MNKLLFVTCMVFGAGDGLAAPQGGGYDAYRRVVLGDTSVVLSSALASDADGDTRVLGSYGKYLMYLGLSKSAAAAQAERIGEQTTTAMAAPPARLEPLRGYELYQRTVLGRTDGEILRERHAAASMRQSGPGNP